MFVKQVLGTLRSAASHILMRSALFSLLLATGGCFRISLPVNHVPRCGMSRPVAPPMLGPSMMCDTASPKDGDKYGKMTEDMVEGFVERAEALWAEALAARELADKLSSEAETLADASGEASDAASTALDGASKFSLSMLTTSTEAQNKALEAGKVIAEAVEAAEAAEELERKAEEALTASEKAIEQHLIDFPDSAEE